MEVVERVSPPGSPILGYSGMWDSYTGNIISSDAVTGSVPGAELLSNYYFRILTLRLILIDRFGSCAHVQL